MVWVSCHTCHILNVRVSLLGAVDFHRFCFTSKQFCAALWFLEQRFCSKTFKVLPAPFMCIPRDNPVSVLRLLLAPAAI